MPDFSSRVILGAVLLSALGCGRVHLGSDDGGDNPIDAGFPIECGAVICPMGTICCNASCGICTSDGEACPAIECVGCQTDEECGMGAYCAWPDGVCGP